MSNYQARQRAIRAERAALRCEQLVDEMREQCRRRERQIWDEARDRFEMEHAFMKRQMEAITESIVQARECAVGTVIYGMEHKE